MDPPDPMGNVWNWTKLCFFTIKYFTTGLIDD